MEIRKENIESYLQKNPNAKLQDYVEYLDKMQDKMKQEQEDKNTEWNNFFKETYVGQYVIVNHNDNSFSVFGPVEESWNRNTNIKSKDRVIDIHCNDDKVYYEFSNRDINAYWLYYPHTDIWTDYTTHKTTVITKEQYEDILKRTKQFINSEKQYIKELTETIVHYDERIF